MTTELPFFLSIPEMAGLGYHQIDHPDGPPYFKFENLHGTKAPDYGIMATGKIVITINLDAGYSAPFVKIGQDCDTRTVFHGVVENQGQLRLLLNLIR